MTSKRRPVLVAACVGAVAAAALLVPAMASAHDGDRSLVHACVHKKSKLVRLVDAKAACTRNERAVHWALQGPQGDRGSAGPAGPEGPAGSGGSIDGVVAAGDLSGTYPDPTIAPGAVSLPELGFDPFTQDEFTVFESFLSVVGVINSAVNPVHWTKLKGVPAGFADGADETGGLGSYCTLVEANPWTYSDAPCRARREAVDSAASVGEHTSLAIGTDGNPVVSYYDMTNQALKVTRCNDPACAGGGETVSVVDSAAAVGWFTSLAIGTDGNPVVSYYDMTNQDLKVTRCNDPACAGGDETSTAVDSAGNIGRHTSLAIGTDGNPVVSYLDATNGDLKVARCNDPACTGSNETVSAVDSSGTVGHWNSLAIGTDGNPVVSYLDGTNGDLKVARCNDPACTGGDETMSAVDSSGNVGFHTSLAIGIDGNPVVSYHDFTWNFDLKVARCNDPACAGGDETATTVDSAGDVGAYTSLAIGTDGNPVVSYTDNSTGDLKVARCNDPACAGGDETVSTVDSAGYVGEWTSLAIGTDGTTVVSYWDRSNGDLKIARPAVG